MSENIYRDLGIDWSNMMKDPKGFVDQVNAVADELRAKLRQTDSITTYIAQQKPENNTEEQVVGITSALDAIYKLGDEIPLGNMPELIAAVRKLASDLEASQRHRAQTELTREGLDKSLTHMYYTRLREAFNKTVEAYTTLGIYDCAKLPAMPGNYGGNYQSLVHYVFRFDNEDDSFMNWKIAGNFLNLPSKNLMDVVEYIEANPDCGVSVSKVRS